METIYRAPGVRLKPFTTFLWASLTDATPGTQVPSDRERMVPSGSMHLVFRLSEQPIRIFKSIEDTEGEVFRNGAVAGMRSAYYIKDAARNACTVGVGLRPGACSLFGISANEIAQRHVGLEDLCGEEARFLVERLQEQDGLNRRLDLLEGFLASRAPYMPAIHPAIAHALNRLSMTSDIGTVVAETGYSHRHFVQLFRKDVGINPRVYTRLLRFQKTLRNGVDKASGRWIDIALEAGYADQAHFNREFRELAGLSPTEYLLKRNGESRHVRI